MTGPVERTIKSSQEQAVASWINSLNQIRLEELVSRLNNQDLNLKKTLQILEELKVNVNNVIISNRGGECGLHGYLAEVLEAAFVNARDAITGKDLEYVWVNNNGAVDLVRNSINIQSKFVRSNGHFGLENVREHLNKYPWFLEDGGKYQIPKDFYDKIKYALSLSDEKVKKLSKNEVDGLSKSTVEWIRNFFDNGDVKFGDLEPSVNTYDAVQKGVVNDTIAAEESNTFNRDRAEREQAYKNAQPSLTEGIKAARFGAALEGGTTFCLSVAKKRKEKKFSEFSMDDWKQIGIDTGGGAIKGGIRGGTVYALTNFAAMPFNVASAYVSAAFGIASQLKALENRQVSQEDFIINCETVCLDVSVSALAAMAGQMIIPVPVLGAVIGNIAGEFVYEICRSYGSDNTKKMVEGYHSEMECLNQKLNVQYLIVLQEIRKDFERFKSLEALAFDEDVNTAFIGSIDFASKEGVPSDKILKSISEVDAFFLG